MLTISNVSKRVGDQLIVDGVSFTVNAGERVGVVGPNGAGKTTLLAMLAGDLAPDDGTVTRPSGIRVGYLRQGFADRPDGTLTDLLDVATDGLAGTLADLEGATAALAEPDADQDAALDRYDRVLAAFEDRGGYAASDGLTAMLGRMGLALDELAAGLATPLGSLSGGQKTRAGLAGLLASDPDCLLLDEPTNHLDIDAIGWLEGLLVARSGAAVIVSHDRAFLDRVATSVLAIDDLTRSWTIHPGGYTDYLTHREEEAEEQAAAYRRQQEKIAQIEADIRRGTAWSDKVHGETQHFYFRARAKKVARAAVTRERKLERLLASEERVEKPERRWGLAAELPAPPPGGRDVAILEGVGVRFGERTILDGIDLHVRHGERCVITGPNGGGKTTLLRVICGDLAPDEGTARLGVNVIVGRFAQEQETIDGAKSAVEQIRAVAPLSESDARTFLHKFLFAGDMATRPAGSLSYGERARLALAIVVLRGANLLVLDEPLNHLDLPSREQFEAALSEFAGTMLLVLHDRATIEHLATRVIELRDGRVESQRSQVESRKL